MKQQKKRRVTLQQVAEHAGVSTSTASLIVRNNPRISEATREKVLQSMRELGYVYDRVAANLRSQTSTTVGLIITDISNTFFSEFLIGVQNTLEEVGLTVLLGTTFDSVAKQEQLISTMLEHRVGGLILCPVSGAAEETLSRLEQLDIPVVLAVREIADADCDFVGADYEEGTYKAVRHFIEKGHQEIAFLGGVKHSSTWTKRMKGFKKALREAGLEVKNEYVIDSAPTREAGCEAVTELLRRSEHPTAIFCFSDLVAFGVMQGIRKAGLVPGEDIDIVGFDNVPEAEISYPPLTTVSSFPRQSGKEAAQLLHHKITNSQHKKQRIILAPELVIRESSQKKRNA
ncbi:LacI family DNA-binding transcriptional regulator [Bacillus velezensis]|uniref:LacI family DNA-binding transcriptional regulator n=1 Tax=Bacillus TaxID=1386 RepID=UPI0015934895|nr:MULTISPECIES: LacI family DNA-binding transcriptional regulator [Bacillus]MBT0952799.1 LacI family DNA-binding transcriptional regulator [Bacillus velezensis]MCQ9195158.1 LacI family DNA-binding transcriptional regulator [Bacillus velezensis]MCX2917945.1 LacI family DNA-binding transcriptional regulator [Bacillus velezensis]MCY6276839.1 LacI family DNA-binding transcriptional regulator [Bacillus sp. NEAU-16]MDA3609380.1 LacI family DNA-binding transcriptional regulator [Bacillus sp. NEAU-24